VRVIELPPFEGKRTDNITDNVHSFKQIKKANNWDDNLAVDHLKCNLRGIAGDWLRRYEKVATNAVKPLDLFLDDLQSNLRAQSYSHMAERELYTRFQKKGVDVRVFVSEMLRLIERMDPATTDERKIVLIKNYMLPHLLARIGSPHSIEELIHRAEEHTLTKQ
jgi:hypothetical protein